MQLCGFNGAAAEVPRSAGIDRLDSIHIHASMGPRLKCRGAPLKLFISDRLILGFNGAAAEVPRSGVIHLPQGGSSCRFNGAAAEVPRSGPMS